MTEPKQKLYKTAKWNGTYVQLANAQYSVPFEIWFYDVRRAFTEEWHSMIPETELTEFRL